MYSRTNTNALLISNCVFRSTSPSPWVFIKITRVLLEIYPITPWRRASLNQTSTLSLAEKRAGGTAWQPSPRRRTAGPEPSSSEGVAEHYHPAFFMFFMTFTSITTSVHAHNILHDKPKYSLEDWFLWLVTATSPVTSQSKSIKVKNSIKCFVL